VDSDVAYSAFAQIG
jgi:hypothetical protein